MNGRKGCVVSMAKGFLGRGGFVRSRGQVVYGQQSFCLVADTRAKIQWRITISSLGCLSTLPPQLISNVWYPKTARTNMLFLLFGYVSGCWWHKSERRWCFWCLLRLFRLSKHNFPAIPLSALHDTCCVPQLKWLEQASLLHSRELQVLYCVVSG